MSFDPSRKYKGWSTVQTWCIALCINNNFSLLTQALEAISGANPPDRSEVILMALVTSNASRVVETAPWAWDEGQSFIIDVDWAQLREHYESKTKGVK